MMPQRTCAGCKKVGEKGELIRFVLSPALHIQVDLKGRLPGRGVYLCPQRLCFEQALKGQRLSKVFRKSVCVPSLENLTSQVVQECQRKITALVGLANRAREVKSGRTSLIQALQESKVQLLLIAEDAAENSQKEYFYLCGKRGVNYHILFTQEELGSMVGKYLRNALGLLGPNFISAIERYIMIKKDMETVSAGRAGQTGGR